LYHPEARASLIWMVGESAEKLVDATEILGGFAKQFRDENTIVQLQILSAVVKLFLKKPNEGQEIVQSVLQTATQSCDNPDIRDRAYIYWRLLSTSSQVAQVDLSLLLPLLAELLDGNAGTETANRSCYSGC
jgi:vesicle coat complex subunit